MRSIPRLVAALALAAMIGVLAFPKESQAYRTSGCYPVWRDGARAIRCDN